MLDNLDYRILEIIQKNNLTPQRDIGDKIGLSAAAVQRRIKKMRDSGIIAQDNAILDCDKIGNNITILAEVYLESETTAKIEALKKKFTSVPEIQQCYYVTGESDFILIIIMPTMKFYEKLTKEIFFDDPNIKRFRTVVAMDIHKNSLEIPLSILHAHI